MIRKLALYGSGILAMVVAVYHGMVGDAMMQALPLAFEDTMMVRATFQIGSMGWLMGGLVLIGAARVQSQKARNWMVGPLVPLYGFPAIGNFMLTGGQLSFGWIALALVTILALVGRKQKQSSQPFINTVLLEASS